MIYNPTRKVQIVPPQEPIGDVYDEGRIVPVLGACIKLNQMGIEISKPTIRTGIKNVVKNTGLSGRWQILDHAPLTICDTGHNEGGLREVMHQISTTLHAHLHFVFGVVNDKYLPPILDLLPKDATYYFCKPNIPRGLDASELMRQATAAGLTGACYDSVKSALLAARNSADLKDLIFIGGSTFVVAELM